MFASQFDGNAAFSGGGFMPQSQSTQSAEASFSPAKSRAEALIPLTVKQINEALLTTGDKFNCVVDGVDVNNVSVVGLVFSKVERVTDVGFVLDDGSGRIDVHRWVNEAYDTKEAEGIREGMYVRVYGNLKVFQGKRQLVAYATRPITDFNEITFHFLECIYVHVRHAKLRATNEAADAQTMPSAYGTPFRGHQGAQQNQQFRGQFGEHKDLDQMVVDYLLLPQNMAKEKGVHVRELVQQLNIPHEKILSSMKTLEDEGLVYSTIDDDHYKSTANA